MRGLGLGLQLGAVTQGGGTPPAALPSELIANGDFSGAGPPPTLAATVGDPPIISGGTLIFDPTASSEASAGWTALATISLGNVTINLDNLNEAGGYNIRVGGTDALTGGTVGNYSGSLVNEVLNVTTVDGNAISIIDQFSGNDFDNFSITQ